jgi:phosphatidylinositol alpha-mannosyltransferase
LAVRVALVCPYSLTVPGGVQTQVLALARALRALGSDAWVLGPCDSVPTEANVVPLGRSIPFSSNGSVAPVAPDAACVARTLKVLPALAPDVVHLHEPLVPGPTLAALLTSERPIVGTFHRHGPSRIYTALRPWARWAARRLDLRCAVSVDALATARAALGGEYTLVPNGVELDRFTRAVPWPTEGPTILFLGRHEPRKGLAVLLEAFGRLSAGARLWVAGQGPETKSLHRRFGGQRGLEWLGRISEEEKASRLLGAHVYSAPSLHGESFGVVLLEAMAAGTPVVASDLQAYRLVARPGLDALLVPPGDPAALALALERVLEDMALAESLAKAGRARAGRFSMRSVANRYLSLYEELLAAGAGGPAQISRLKPARILAGWPPG